MDVAELATDQVGDRSVKCLDVACAGDEAHTAPVHGHDSCEFEPQNVDVVHHDVDDTTGADGDGRCERLDVVEPADVHGDVCAQREESVDATLDDEAGRARDGVGDERARRSDVRSADVLGPDVARNGDGGATGCGCGALESLGEAALGALGDDYGAGCAIAGPSGSEMCCPLRVAVESVGLEATTLQVDLRFASDKLQIVGFCLPPCGMMSGQCVGAEVGDGGDVPIELVTGQAVYAHPTSLSPEEGEDVKLAFVLDSAEGSISEAVWQDGEVVGDPEIFCVRFELLEDVDCDTPVAVGIKHPVWGAAVASPVKAKVVNGVIVFAW